jgi:hypothetical protein
MKNLIAIFSILLLLSGCGDVTDTAPDPYEEGDARTPDAVNIDRLASGVLTPLHADLKKYGSDDYTWLEDEALATTMGTTAVGDGGQGRWWFDEGSSDSDNGTTIRTANDGSGAWKLLSPTAADAENVDDLITLSGVAAGETDLSTFTGDIIGDDSTIKEALQALETDADAVQTLTGVAAEETELGVFTGDTITDDQTIKDALQELETAHEELDDTVVDQASVITDNIADIIENADELADNASDIADNTTDIATNAAAIVTANTNIATNAAAISNQVTVSNVTYRKENLAAADDNYEFFVAHAPMTVESIGVHCVGTCTTEAEISLEDRAGTAMTHSVPDASTGTDVTKIYSVTANNSLVTGEGLRFDVDNAVDPETDEYLIMISYKTPDISYDYMSFYQTGDTGLDFDISLPVNKTIEIVWGDGDKTTVNGPVTTTNYAHTYASTATYGGMIRYDKDDVTYLSAASEAGLSFDIADLPTSLAGALNFTNTSVYGDLGDLPAGLDGNVYLAGTDITGDISDIPVACTDDLDLSSTAVTGGLSDLPALTGSLDLSDTVVEGDIADLPDLVDDVDLSDSSVEGDIADLPASITGSIDLSNTSVDTYTGGAWPCATAASEVLNFTNLELSTAEVDNLIIDIEAYADAPASIEDGTLTLTGNSARSSTSDTAYTELTTTLNWTVGLPVEEMDFSNDGSVDQTIVFKISLPEGSECEIDWGDTNTSTVTGPQTETEYSHTYAGTSTYNGTIDGDWDDVTYLACNSEAGLTFDFESLPTGLTEYLGTSGTPVTGELSDIPSGFTGNLVINNNLLITGNISGLPSGMTGYLYLDDTSVTGALSGLPSGLTSTINLERTTASGDIADLPSNAASNIWLSDTSVDTYTGGSWPCATGNNKNIMLDDLDLTSTIVDNILIDLAATSITGGTLDLSGNDDRTSASTAAKATLLSRNWNITVGEPAEEEYLAEYYVTQSGGGSHNGSSLVNAYSVAEFNALSGDYSDVVYYFSGAITEQLKPTVYGTSGHPVTIDGYEAGDCDPINSECTSSAYYTGAAFTPIWIYDHDYITFQDFRMKSGSSGGITIGCDHTLGYCDADDTTNIIVRRNLVDTCSGTALYLREVENVTIGGASGDGNLLLDAAEANDDGKSVNFLIADDVIFSYNEIAGTPSDNYISNGMEIHSCQDVLIEYNNIHHMLNESGISIKESEFEQKNIIVRYNYIHDLPGGFTSYGISVTRGQTWSELVHQVYIYGNYIHDVEVGMKFCENAEQVYAWSNVIDDATNQGLLTLNKSATPTWDPVENIYWYNNTMVNIGTSGDIDATGLKLFHTDGGAGATFKNNIFYNCFGSNTKYNSIYVYDSANDDTVIDYNLHYNPSGLVNIYEYNTYETVGDGDAYTAYGYEQNGAEDNPDFTAVGSDDYTLTAVSPAIDMGETLSDSVLPSYANRIDIQGTTYCEDSGTNCDETLTFATALDPDTVWTGALNPTTILTLDRDAIGWDNGAYGYE